MTLKFIHPTAAQTMRLASILVAFADLWLTYAATIQAQPWIPAGLAMYWPLVGFVALVVHQAASTFGIAPDAATTNELKAAVAIAQVGLPAALASIEARAAASQSAIPPK